VIIERLESEILARGQSDYTGLWELPAVLRHIEPDMSPMEIKKSILKSVRSLASKELVEIGELARISIDEPLVEFVRWPVSVAQAMERIETEWDSLAGELDIGAIGWLSNTPAGDFVAQGLRENGVTDSTD
jgi:hypothetical protein